MKIQATDLNANKVRKVLLNGEEVRFCIMVDTDHGIVEYYKTDANGNVACDPNGNPIVVRDCGKVEIEFKEPCPVV